LTSNLFFELILSRQLTMRTTVCWRSLASWGPRLKPT